MKIFHGLINEFVEMFNSSKGNLWFPMVGLEKFARCLIHPRKFFDHWWREREWWHVMPCHHTSFMPHHSGFHVSIHMSCHVILVSTSSKKWSIIDDRGSRKIVDKFSRQEKSSMIDGRFSDIGEVLISTKINCLWMMVASTKSTESFICPIEIVVHRSSRECQSIVKIVFRFRWSVMEIHLRT
jgi:hypothetical protein